MHDEVAALVKRFLRSVVGKDVLVVKLVIE